jgi:hypothetical protein
MLNKFYDFQNFWEFIWVIFEFWKKNKSTKKWTDPSCPSPDVLHPSTHGSRTDHDRTLLKSTYPNPSHLIRLSVLTHSDLTRRHPILIHNTEIPWVLFSKLTFNYVYIGLISGSGILRLRFRVRGRRNEKGREGNETGVNIYIS